MKEREKITMLTTIIIVVAIYFVAMLGIGWYGRRYSSTFDGYLSMGRSGGILLLMGSAIGANIGNGFVVGGAGGGATSGLAGRPMASPVLYRLLWRCSSAILSISITIIPLQTILANGIIAKSPA